MNADDRELIERTRRVNKTLSMFVFALQEAVPISIQSQQAIADMLQALGDTVRVRTVRPAVTSGGPPLAIEVASSVPLAPEPG